MVVYLNDVTGEGGETRFIIPNITSGELPEMPMTVPQEMDYYGQHGGVETISIKPVRGRCLLFTHDWLHESFPLQEGSKFILRTDIVATCPETPVFMSRKEVIDYQQTLELFNEAEQMELGASAYRQEKAFEDGYHALSDSDHRRYEDELRFRDEHCEEYDSKSLYLRYRYPSALGRENANSVENASLEIAFGILGDMTVRVFEFLPITEAIQLLIMCPSLKQYVDALEVELVDDAKEFCKQYRLHVLLEPTSIEGNGLTGQFQFRLNTSLDFHEHYEAWCRVSAVLVIHKVMHAC